MRKFLFNLLSSSSDDEKEKNEELLVSFLESSVLFMHKLKTLLKKHTHTKEKKPRTIRRQDMAL